MSDDFDAQLAGAFKDTEGADAPPAPKKGKRGRPKSAESVSLPVSKKGKERPEKKRKKDKRDTPVAPFNTPEGGDEGQGLQDPGEAGNIVEKEADDLKRQIIRYCDAFPEHAGNTRMMVEADRLSIPELEFELAQITRRVNQQQELSMMRTGLITGCAAIEFGTSFIPGQPVKLQGFSGSVSADISSFDTCLKQIMCKYGNEFVMSVEATLGLLLVKHAFTTHMANAAAASKVKIEKETPQPKPHEEKPNTAPEVIVLNDEVVD
jgi:hypothetical protein